MATFRYDTNPVATHAALTAPVAMRAKTADRVAARGYHPALAERCVR
jgi:hypothetical protein